VVPCINLKEHLKRLECQSDHLRRSGHRPIVWAINQVASVRYAEIISAVASKSAGIGTRQNIDEFTQTTARSLENLGGAKKARPSLS